MDLLIDDMRTINVDVIARNYDAGLRMLALGGWDCAVFDHDLGEVRTGYDLMNSALDRGWLPNKIELVTSNPVGRANMERALFANGYVKKGVQYVKE